MLQWKDIDTVLLDMDGTLLDLHFDNHFWLEYLPLQYAKKYGLKPDQAIEQLTQRFNSQFGQLNWYCLDYWGKELDMDIVQLKIEISHLIQMRDDVPTFLKALKKANKRIVLVTNAHPDSLSLKIEKTALSEYIEEMISTHEFGITKESLDLWQQLQAKLGFDKDKTLFIDDSLGILKVAETFGIKHIVAINNPDSKQEARDIKEFKAITDYQQLMPIG